MPETVTTTASSARVYTESGTNSVPPSATTSVLGSTRPDNTSSTPNASDECVIQRCLSQAYTQLPAVGREVRRRMPRAAHVAERAGSAAHAVATTEEGKRVASSAGDFVRALLAFAVMLALAVLKLAEECLDVPPKVEESVFQRVVKVGGACVQRVDMWIGAREKDRPHSMEARVYRAGRTGVDLGAKSMRSVVSGAKGYSRLGKEYVDVVVKAVEKVVPAADPDSTELSDAPVSVGERIEVQRDVAATGTTGVVDGARPVAAVAEQESGTSSVPREL